MQIVLEIGMAGINCVRLPGWTVVIVAMLLTAPRMADKWLQRSGKG